MKLTCSLITVSSLFAHHAIANQYLVLNHSFEMPDIAGNTTPDQFSDILSPQIDDWELSNASGDAGVFHNSALTINGSTFPARGLKVSDTITGSVLFAHHDLTNTTRERGTPPIAD